MILNNESLDRWVTENLLSVKVINERTIEITDIGKFLLVEPKDIQYDDNNLSHNVIFDNQFQIQLNEIEDKYCDSVDYLLFQFGDRWYYSDSLTPEELKEFKFLGKANISFETFPYLGIHGGYELCSGSRLYEDWCKKAKFLGAKTLGICELNTLAGTIDFQESCIKSEIKPVIGETITILTDTKAKFNIKLYVINNKGWENLLHINQIINVHNKGEYIQEDTLWLDCSGEGLVCVLTPEVDLKKYLELFTLFCSNLYYQLDFSEWSSQTRDESWLLAIQEYLNTYISDKIAPVLIYDSYYLDKADHIIKSSLNSIGKVGFRNQSADQYFKSTDDIMLQASAIFNENDPRFPDIITDSISYIEQMCSQIYFKIPTSQFRLPNYEMTEEEKIKYNSPEEMLWDFIGQGLEKKILGKVSDENVYLERIQSEFEVIKAGNIISYFLILADIVRWCNSQNILVGIGRGSSAGSLIAYCCDITKIDPIKYELLFERFLNAGRIGKSLPDIDTDFPGERRDEVKGYIEQKYGKDYVTNIGTFSNLKIKSSLKDLCREKGVDYNKTNYAASLLEKAEIKDKMNGMTLTEFFKFAVTKPELKEFIQKHHSVIEKFNLCLNQPKTSSIHASGVVIVPKELGTIYQQMPIKQIDGMLVSEWEGEYIDKAGFLKCDILGIKQLDKIAAIFKLIQETTGDNVSFDTIILDDADVMQLFQDGYTEDVFQFGTPGLKAYCKEMKPDNINDLIAAVALYRPGAMETGAHKKYIRVKNRQEVLSYDEGTEKITSTTYGILVYQEQIMQVCSIMAGFNLVESDDIRKALGKKDMALLDSYKDKFLKGCLDNGFTKSKILDLWDKMESFAKYSFNKSHAAAYAITGYYCQWLKCKYPIQFWTVSMQYAEEKDVINRISEINKVSDIEVATVDINKSTRTFYAENNTIYWSINSVKWVGDKAVEEIINERMYKGEFFSVEDFCDRLKSRSINKRCIINLILAGAFDKIEKIQAKDRYQLLLRYHTFTNTKISEELENAKNWKDYQWVLKQKELTGFGVIDYHKIVKSSKQFATLQKKFKENVEVLFADEDDTAECVISGIVQAVVERKSKKGVFGQVEIIDNTDRLYITLWNDAFEPVRQELAEAKNSIIILNGVIKFDGYKQSNVIHSSKRTQLEIV